MADDDQTTQRVVVPFQGVFNSARDTDKVINALTAKYGSGWRIEGVETDPAGDQRLIAVRPLTLMKITADSRRTKSINEMPDGVRPGDADKWATIWASQYPGFYLTMWDPHVRRAKLTKLTDDEVRCRGAVADAMGVKPWDVQVSSRPDGGFDLQLPTYSPSKHDAKLNEVATSNIGKPGWYVKVDPATNIASIIPGELPTFNPAYPYPIGTQHGSLFEFPIGVKLGGPGEPNSVLTVDLSDSAGLSAAGLAGAGKSVWINSVIYSALARGWQLAILDVRQKMADFLWCKDFVRDHGWGCESKTEAVAVIRLIHEEGVRRGDLLSRYGVQKWQELPGPVRRDNPLILLVIDEAQALFSADSIPRSLPRENPLRAEAERSAMESDLLKAYTGKVPAEMRAAGIRMLLVSQQQQMNTGISPSMKMNLPNKVLLGPNATRQARGHALANPDAAPEVPAWIKADERAARGCGVAEIEGRAPAVFKGFYASTDDYRKRLLAAGARQTREPNPTAEQIARLVPQFGDDPDAEPSGVPDRRGVAGGGDQEWRPAGADRFLADHPEFGPQVTIGADGKRLQGAAAAQAAAHRLEQQARRS